MKQVSTTLLALLSLNVFAGEHISVIGIPSINSVGIIAISECNTGNAFTIGTMASNPYFKLSNAISELSKTGSVLVTVRGEVNEGESYYLKYPEVITVKQGNCDGPST